MTALTALTGARIFDGDLWHEDSALLLADGKVAAIAAARDVPADARVVPMDGHSLVPGFIDLQVNGGGGVLLNERPDLEGIRTICAAHARFGTTGLLPTLITDNVQVTTETIAAGLAAQAAKVPGFLGLHLEGPHLSVARKGAHDPNLIRPMEQADRERTIEARHGLDALLRTLAPAHATTDQLAAWRAAGGTGLPHLAPPLQRHEPARPPRARHGRRGA